MEAVLVYILMALLSLLLPMAWAITVFTASRLLLPSHMVRTVMACTHEKLIFPSGKFLGGSKFMTFGTGPPG
jgi:hypothetical protein